MRASNYCAVFSPYLHSKYTYMKVENKECVQRLEVHREYLLPQWYAQKKVETP